jgi:dolichol-phosphate mannosyltransferase
MAREFQEISLPAIAVIPTYDEIENLPRIVELVRAQPGGWHILVVDDGSPDGTGRLADELSGAEQRETHAGPESQVVD